MYLCGRYSLRGWRLQRVENINFEPASEHEHVLTTPVTDASEGAGLWAEGRSEVDMLDLCTKCLLWTGGEVLLYRDRVRASAWNGGAS